MIDKKRILTCVYCGHEYPQDTPSWGDTILTEHIKVCEKHPMRIHEEALKVLQEITGSNNIDNPWLGVVAAVQLLKMDVEKKNAVTP